MANCRPTSDLYNGYWTSLHFTSQFHLASKQRLASPTNILESINMPVRSIK